MAQPDQFRQALTPADVLDVRRFTASNRYLLAAQHAATEAGVTHNQRSHWPKPARIAFRDTIQLAMNIVPGLLNHKLDTVLAHLAIGATRPSSGNTC